MPAEENIQCKTCEIITLASYPSQRSQLDDNTAPLPLHSLNIVEKPITGLVCPQLQRRSNIAAGMFCDG